MTWGDKPVSQAVYCYQQSQSHVNPCVYLQLQVLKKNEVNTVAYGSVTNNLSLMPDDSPYVPSYKLKKNKAQLQEEQAHTESEIEADRETRGQCRE